MSLLHILMVWTVLSSQWFAETELIEGRSFWRMDTVEAAATREPAGDAIRYQIVVEHGLEAEAAEFVETVDRVLSDPRSWNAAGYRFVRVDERARFKVVLATPETTDELCLPLRTAGTYSCGNHHRAVLNADRWIGGTETWGDEVDGYREYMVDHEVGHLIGMPHRRCPEPGTPAPVMAQQTITLGGCRPAGYPATTEIEHLRTKWAARNRSRESNHRSWR